MRVGIVGCGLAGTKRARAVDEGRIVAVADTDRARAETLAAERDARVETDWRAVTGARDVDLVIVATTHDTLAPVTLAAVEEGKHVLVEKPGALSASELQAVAQAARRRSVHVAVGYNHRFHPALRQAHALFRDGAIGPLLYVRARYGHGGRAGYEREWRCDPASSGGGELMDQGVHLIDLARWFAGDFDQVTAHLARFFWDSPVEDNAFLLLESAAGPLAWLHASWTEWKNLFSFEVYGRDGKLQVDGLGGSYGPERLALYRTRPEMGPPDTFTWDYPAEDLSWRDEYRALLASFRGEATAGATIEDALAVLTLVERAYGRAGEPVRRPAQAAP